jgi:hypothetical protein
MTHRDGAGVLPGLQKFKAINELRDVFRVDRD